MKTLKNNFSDYWPLFGLILLILVLSGDIAARVLSVGFPPGLVGAAILLSGCGLFVLLKPNSLTDTLLGGVVAAAISGGILIIATAAVPLSGSIQLLAIAVAAGFAGSVALFAPTVQSKHRAATNIELVDSTPENPGKLEELVTVTGTGLQGDLDHLFEESGTEDEPDEEILLSWQRFRLKTGSERLEGTLTLQFRAGEKIQHYHLPISPALKSIPAAWGESCEPGVRIDFDILQTYGVRLTARRGAGSLEEAEVQVDFIVVSDQREQAAA